MRNRTRASLVATLAAAAAAALATAAPAGAGTQDEISVYNCTASWVDSPHYSVTSGSVIAKPRIKCTGDPGATEQFQVFGSLYRVGGGSCGTPAQGPGVRIYYSWLHDGPVTAPIEFWVTANNSTPKTLYIPILGSSSKFTTNATYYASAAIYRASDDRLFNTEWSPYRFTGPNCP